MQIHPSTAVERQTAEKSHAEGAHRLIDAETDGDRADGAHGRITPAPAMELITVLLEWPSTDQGR